MRKFIRAAFVSALIAGISPVIADTAVDTTTTATAPVVTTTAPVVATANTASSDFTSAQITQLQTIIHDYIVNNPQVLVEASKTLQAQQEKKMESDAVVAIKQNKAALFDDAKSPSIGSKDAPVTLVEFFDYQCGHCREMQPQLEKLLSEDKNIHVIFKELPIFGGVSDFAAKAALAAQLQKPEKYFAFHNALLTSNKPLDEKVIMDIAQKVGLNVSILKKEMATPAISEQLRSNFQLAQNLKIMGTPTFVIANKDQTKFAYIPGALPLAELQSQLKSVQ